MEFCRHPGGRGFSKSDPYLKGMESYMYHSKLKKALEKVRLTYSLKDTVLFSWANWSGMMRLVWQPYASLVLFLYNYVYSRLAQSRVFTVSVSRSVLHRRGSRTNTDRFPKRAPKAQDSRAGGGGGVWRHAPPWNFLDFNFLKCPFLGFPSHSDRISATYIHLEWSLASWKVFYSSKIYLLWKICTISVKRWKTGVDPRLLVIFPVHKGD